MRKLRASGAKQIKNITVTMNRQSRAVPAHDHRSDNFLIFEIIATTLLVTCFFKRSNFFLAIEKRIAFVLIEQVIE